MNMTRVRAGALSVLTAAVCAATLTACGTHSAASTGTASASAPKVSLDIQVTKPGAKPEHWTLRCDPAGGTHPDPQAACNALLHAKSPFAALPGHMSCPMIPAGTPTATVKGTWFGKHIDTSFNRSGCGMPRWSKVGQIFN